MDLDTYYEISQYLSNPKFLKTLNPQQERKLKSKTRHLFIQDGILYKENRHKPNSPLRIIKKNEVETILYNMHSDLTAGHFAFDGTFQQIISRYFWPGLGKDIKNYIKACKVYQEFGGRKRQEPLHPIKVGQPFE